MTVWAARSPLLPPPEKYEFWISFSKVLPKVRQFLESTDMVLFEALPAFRKYSPDWQIGEGFWSC